MITLDTAKVMRALADCDTAVSSAPIWQHCRCKTLCRPVTQLTMGVVGYY